MVRDAFDRFLLIRIAGEVRADIISHRDEVMNIHCVSVTISYSMVGIRIFSSVTTPFRRDLDGGDLELGTVGRPIGMIGHQIVGARFRMMKRGVHDAGLHALSHQRTQASLAAARPHLEPISVADAAQLGVARMDLEAILRVHRGIQSAPRLSTNIILTEYSASSQYQRIL